MRYLTRSLTLTALLAGLPGLAQSPTHRPTRQTAERPVEVSKDSAAGKPKPVDGGVALTWSEQVDAKLTQTLRKDLDDDQRLSLDAKNVKIITTRGQITLRGEVRSSQERTIISDHAIALVGPYHVVDELTVRGAAPATN